MSYEHLLDNDKNGNNNSDSESDTEENTDVKLKQKGNKIRRLNEAVLSSDHVAAIKLLEQRVDVNINGTFGRTPLHNAVLKGDMRMIKLLLDRGNADVTCRDDRDDTPLHFATRTGRAEIVQVLLKRRNCDVNSKGSNGVTPLHIAASLNKPDICKILLEHDATIDSKDINGKNPLGVAMESGAAVAAQYLLEYIKQMQLNLDKYLYDVDHDGSTLLHLAVDSGFTQVVSLCIENGSRIREPKRLGRYTAFHLACEQGSTEIVLLLISKDQGVAKILLVDGHGTTPLHIAAKSNNHGIVELLIAQGANVNARNDDNVTPLMMAALSGATESVRLLMDKGADATIKDIDGRTTVFNAVGHGITMEVLLQNDELVPLLVEKDALGFAPPHYAAKQGDIASIRLFLAHNKLAASVLSDSQDTPLHVAARHGWHEIVRAVLEKQGGKIVNLQDNRGRTALHYAAAVSSHRATNALLRHGAIILRDHEYRTPLHEAAIIGSKKIIESILERHMDCLNFVDEDKNTALHLATHHGHDSLVIHLLSVNQQEILMNSSNQNILDMALEMDSKAVVMTIIEHDRWREVINTCNAGSTAMVKKLVENMPEVAERLLDQCVQKEGDPYGADFKVKYDLSLVLNKSTPGQKATLQILQTMAQNRRDKCLTHPLCFILLSNKWRRYGSVVFIVNLVLYLAFLLPMTWLHIELEDGDLEYCGERLNKTVSTSENLVYLEDQQWPCLRTHLDITILQIWLNVFSFIHILKELVALYIQRMRYVKSPSNLLDIIAYSSALISIMPMCECKWGHQKEAAAIAMFCGWLILIMHLRRLSFYGKYVIMLYRMFITLLKVMVLFIFFAMAFGTTFHLLIDKEPSFQSLPTVLMTMFVMTLGEINYADTFFPWKDLFYPGLVNLFIVLFCLAMPIILMNMLVGLAVGDIDKIERNALIDRYIMQVNMLNDIEEALPQWLLQKLRMKQYTDYPNRTPPIHSMIFESLLGFGGSEDEDELDEPIDHGPDFDEIKEKLDEHAAEVEEINETLRTVLRMLYEQQEMLQEARQHTAPITNKLTSSALDIKNSMTSFLNFPKPGFTLAALPSLPFGGKTTEETSDTPEEK